MYFANENNKMSTYFATTAGSIFHHLEWRNNPRCSLAPTDTTFCHYEYFSTSVGEIGFALIIGVLYTLSRITCLLKINQRLSFSLISNFLLLKLLLSNFLVKHYFSRGSISFTNLMHRLFIILIINK